MKPSSLFAKATSQNRVHQTASARKHADGILVATRPVFRSLLLLVAIAATGIFGVGVSAQEAAPGIELVPGKWVSVFNGKDLSGWTPKIRYSPVGENYGNTFRVEDGLLKVRYDEEAYPEFGNRFGHLFFDQPLSSYRLRVTYRFVGEQTKGGAGWALRNSGMMLHGESPKTMAVDQDFPASIEVQLLGGNGTNPRTTCNLCTPGTNVVMKGKLFLPHCTSSTSKTYHGDKWVTAEVEVRGSKLVRHIMEGETVLEYTNPQLDDRDTHAAELADARDGNLLDSGTISLQSESHPCDFKSVEIMLLEDPAE
ncbi:MAG: DUF1080 domain-containing protein [Planctomycetota bacterium]